MAETAQKAIDKALTDVGVKMLGVDVTDQQYTDAIESLNDMVALLEIEGIEPIPNPEFLLFDMKKCEAIIGAKLMQQLRMVLNPLTKEISFR